MQTCGFLFCLKPCRSKYLKLLPLINPRLPGGMDVKAKMFSCNLDDFLKPHFLDLWSFSSCCSSTTDTRLSSCEMCERRGTVPLLMGNKAISFQILSFKALLPPQLKMRLEMMPSSVLVSACDYYYYMHVRTWKSLSHTMKTFHYHKLTLSLPCSASFGFHPTIPTWAGRLKWLIDFFLSRSSFPFPTRFVHL